MDIDSASTLINNPYHYHQNETVEASFNEQLAAALGENFLDPWPPSTESNNTSAHWDYDCNVIEHFMSPSHICTDNGNQHVIVPNEKNINHSNKYDDDNDDDDVNNNNNNNNNDNNNNNYKNNNNMDSSNNVNVQRRQQIKGKEETKKRKRQPSQVQDHIIAERKRRELLSQMFISLSALVPGLKKVDKTSVLGETIKHMKHLQEKVKVLEEAATNRKLVVVKNSSSIIDNDYTDSSSTVDDHCASGNGGLNPNKNNNNNNNNNNIHYNGATPVSEIEVKISGNTLLLKVCCEDQKGILAKLFAELDKHGVLSVSNCSVIPFGSLGLDITIAAQIQERCFNDNVRGFIRSLRSTLRLS